MLVLRWMLLLALPSLGGCVSIATHYIEYAGHNRPSAQFVRLLGEAPPYYWQREFQTSEGLRIAYWYATPQALDITDKVSVESTCFSANFSWKPPDDHRPQPPTRGSVVVLHFWGPNATQMIYWGLHSPTPATSG